MHREHPITSYTDLLAPDTQVIDVREPEEVAHGMLPEAKHIALGELPDRTDELDADKPVLLVCRSGNRSGQAAEYLTAMGFGDVTNLTGGMLDYTGPTVTP